MFAYYWFRVDFLGWDPITHHEPRDLQDKEDLVATLSSGPVKH